MDKHRELIGCPLDHENHKVLLDRLISTYHESRRNKKEGEVIKGIRLDACTYGFNVLQLI